MVPGNASASPLVKMLKGELQPRMPVGRPEFPAEQIALVTKWIDSLPPGERTEKKQPIWAYQKPVVRPVPTVKTANWARTDIDRFVLAKLEAKGLTPSPPASAATLLRRVYLDLVGVPPTPDEARRFPASATPEAVGQLIDRLLADPRFGERWGRHWLDLVRYADTQGFEADRENYHMWRYRDYVIQAFQNDKPYDRFLTEQLAGDELPNAGPEQLVATGFLRLTPRFQATNAQELRQLFLDEVTGTVGSVFLGLTVKCAQCHDHKYDPIPQKDFYRLQAFFAAMEMVEMPVAFEDAALRTRLAEATRNAEQRLAEAQQQFNDYQRQLMAKAEAAGIVLPPESDTRAARGSDDDDPAGGTTFVRRTTRRVVELERRIAKAIANGLVPNADDPTFTMQEKQEYLRLLSFVDGTRGGRDMGVYPRELRRYRPAAHVIRNMPNDANRPAFPATFVRINGEFSRLGEFVRPGFPSALTGNQEAAALGSDRFGNVRAWRLPLAAWLTSKENPLTARVMANRIWQHLLGEPIAGTPSDFGRNGSAPVNPELLEHLAQRFMDQKWRMKALIREIMLSAVYQQASARVSAREQKEDPNNLLLWRQNRKRMEGEVLRDSVLHTSGLLNEKRGGPGVMIKLPAAMKERMTIKNLPSWIPVEGAESRRRSVYVFQRRQLEVPFLATMDAPVFQASCERRAVSTTAVQALTLWNDELTTEAAAHLAARTVEQVGPDAREQVIAVFRAILSRPPRPEELARALPLLAREAQGGLQGLCRVLLNTNEFAYVD